MFQNMLSVKRLLPAGGISLKLYPDQSNPGSWVVVIESTKTGTKYISVPEQIIPRGVPASGAELVAAPTETDDWSFAFNHISGPTIRQATVPGASNLKKAIEDIVQSKIDSLVPTIIKLLR